mmetsp:Transcript_86751/g.243046  ORF Transcript_86751/g.243046 Transcript_86751/m.243046 type:complete len:209 (+) Transcript_86751:358-984(+)
MSPIFALNRRKARAESLADRFPRGLAGVRRRGQNTANTIEDPGRRKEVPRAQRCANTAGIDAASLGARSVLGRVTDVLRSGARIGIARESGWRQCLGVAAQARNRRRVATLTPCSADPVMVDRAALDVGARGVVKRHLHILDHAPVRNASEVRGLEHAMVQTIQRIHRRCVARLAMRCARDAIRNFGIRVELDPGPGAAEVVSSMWVQ